MKVDIRDRDALRAISPDALSAYARAAGWSKTDERYGAHSDIYAAEGLPEIIVPRTQRLGDYASVVAQLIEDLLESCQTRRTRALSRSIERQLRCRAGTSRRKR